MLSESLTNRHLILASQSPRRSYFLKELKLDFEVRLKEVKEVYPPDLIKEGISEYLCKLKAIPFKKELTEKDILITADTIVWHDGSALGKPRDENQAREMLRSLSGKTHEVISSVALTTTKDQIIISDTTKVRFKVLSEEEILYYIKNYSPFDKAGSYGIQEWLGYIATERIEGSYFNVMGFPVQKFYKSLLKI